MSILKSHNELKALADKINSIKEYIKEQISSLPNNSKMTKVGDNAFTIKSSDLVNTILTSTFYDYKYQYKKINEFIDTVPPFTIINRLKDVVRDKVVLVKKERIKLHPEVIENLKELLDK